MAGQGNILCMLQQEILLLLEQQNEETGIQLSVHEKGEQPCQSFPWKDTQQLS